METITTQEDLIKNIKSSPKDILSEGISGLGVYQADLLKFIGYKVGKSFKGLDNNINIINTNLLANIDFTNQINNELKQEETIRKSSDDNILNQLNEFKKEIGTVQDFNDGLNED